MKTTALTIALCMALTIAALTTGAQPTVHGQTATTSACSADEYKVREHDVLLLVTNAKTASALDVRRLADNCPQAKQHNRFSFGPNENGPFEYIGAYELANRLENGANLYVKFRWVPGECFKKAGLGNLPIGANGTPTPTPTSTPTPSPTPVVVANTTPTTSLWWLRTLIAAFIILFILWLFRGYLSRRLNPERAGEPMVEGGLKYSVAAAQVAGLLSTMLNVPMGRVEIVEMQAGVGWGIARVGYSGWQWLLQFLWNRRVYRALYRVNGGAIQTAYTLAGCGNILRRGESDLLSTRLFWWRPQVVGDLAPIPSRQVTDEPAAIASGAVQLAETTINAETTQAPQEIAREAVQNPQTAPQTSLIVRFEDTEIVVVNDSGVSTRILESGDKVTIKKLGSAVSVTSSNGQNILVYANGVQFGTAPIKEKQQDLFGEGNDEQQ